MNTAERGRLGEDNRPARRTVDREHQPRHPRRHTPAASIACSADMQSTTRPRVARALTLRSSAPQRNDAGSWWARPVEAPPIDPRPGRKRIARAGGDFLAAASPASRRNSAAAANAASGTERLGAMQLRTWRSINPVSSRPAVKFGCRALAPERRGWSGPRAPLSRPGRGEVGRAPRCGPFPRR